MEMIDLNKKEKTGSSVLLYGKPGSGKTHLLGRLPGKTLIIDLDEGSKVLEDQSDVVDVTVCRIDSLKELDDIVKKLLVECKFDNVCIDTLSEARAQFLAEKAKTNLKNDGSLMGTPTQGDYLKATFDLFNILRSYRRLTKTGVNVIFTAWQTLFEVTNTVGSIVSTYIPMVGSKSGDDAQTITGMVDTVGLIHKEKDLSRTIYFDSPEDRFFGKDRLNRAKCKAKDLLNGKITSKEVVEVPNSGTDTKGTPTNTDAGKTKDNNNNVTKGDK